MALSPIASFLNLIKKPPSGHSDNEIVGIAGFTAYVEFSSEEVTNSKAANHVLENRLTVTDNVTYEPSIITIRGEVADNFMPAPDTSGYGALLDKTLGIVSPFLPSRTLSQIAVAQSMASKAQAKIDQIKEYGNSIYALYNAFGDTKGTDSNQQRFINFMQQLQISRNTIAIETPFRTYEHVIITSFSRVHTNEGNTCEFSLSFQEVIFAETKIFKGNDKGKTPAEKVKGTPQDSIAGSQIMSVANKGISSAKKVNEQMSLKIMEGLK